MSNPANIGAQDTEAHDAAAALTTLRSIADGQQQLIKAQQDNISAQRANIETTEKNTHAINELTLMVERQRGEINTRFQGLEDRIGHVETVQAEAEEQQKETRQRMWAVFCIWLGAVASWVGAHWPFHLSSPSSHGR